MTKKDMISHLVGEGEFTEDELNKMLKPEVQELFEERFDVVEEKDLTKTDIFDPEPIVSEEETKEEEKDIVEEPQVDVTEEVVEEEKIDISKLSKGQLRNFKRTGKI